MQPSPDFAVWSASVSAVICDHLGAGSFVAGMRVFDPVRFDMDTSWATDDLAKRCALDAPLDAPVAITASHPAVKKAPPRSTQGGVFPASKGRFLRLATPIKQLEHMPTLVIQIECVSGARLDRTQEIMLAMCLPAFGNAYYKGVGHIKAHRERLLKKLKSVQRQIVTPLVEGSSERAIAERFGKSLHTVHDHVKGIYAAWGVRSRLQVRDVWFDRPLARGG